MIRVIPIRSFTSILMIFILLASIVCSSVNVTTLVINSQDVITINKASNPSTSDTQLPEKIESENDFKHQGNFFFLHPVGEFLRAHISKSQFTFLYNAFRFRGSTAGAPLFLIKRSILI